MGKKDSSFEQGSSQVWDEVFQRVDLSYSEESETQNQLFEMVKISSLKRIFASFKKQKSLKKVKMLEVGCGTGFVSLYFAKRGYDTTCLDINQSILKITKRNFKKEKVKGVFVSCDAQNLKFTDNSFDLVTSFGLLEHFQDPSKAIKEMVRVLKPGGLFFTDIVPARFSCQGLANVFNFLVTLLFWSLKGKPGTGWQRGKRNFIPLYYENSFSLRKYLELMEKAGLKNLQVRGNRPFPRLTLPSFFDRLYVQVLKLFIVLWKAFDTIDNPFSRFWGAGWWFWGNK